MKNIAIINALNTTEYATRAFSDGRNALEKVMAFARGLPGVKTCAVLAGEHRKEFEGAQVSLVQKSGAKELLLRLNALSAGFDNVYYFFADCPFLDTALASRMFEDHVKYYADYTFADGYPCGLSVEILKAPVLDALLLLVREDDLVNRETIFEVLKRDINAFDIETEISPVDVRMLRVALCADTRRNFTLLTRLFESGACDEQSVLDTITSQPGLLRTLPAYFPIQIVEGCPQLCSYCPYPQFGPTTTGKKAEMDVKTFTAIIDKIAALCGDAVISLSLWGEPALHSAIDALITTVLGHESLDLVIETCGIGWNLPKLRDLACRVKRAPRWIVSLDAPTQDVYEKVRGAGFSEATATARELLALFPGNVYVQAVRMQGNEESLERFFRDWKKETENVIIQKYDDFAGFLPERKITDLSPLKRFPCWHLKRDCPVLLDGTVPMCREDLKHTTVLGNLLSENLADIWKRGEQVYLAHVTEAYPSLCKECDEYYTFNF